jgi:CP family cyanate transporter-like MFS transporter
LLFDHFQLKRVMGFAMALIGFSSLVRSFAANYVTFVLLQMVLGVALGSILPCLPKLVAIWFPHEEEGVATGLYMTGTAIGDITGLALTPWLMIWTGSWRTTFVIYSVWALLLATIWWIIAKQPNGEQLNKVHSEASVTKSLVNVLKMKEIWVLTGFFICAAVCYDMISLWLPNILQLKGMSPAMVGLFVSLLPLGSLMSGPIVGGLSDRFSRRRLLMIGLGAASGLMILLIMLSTDLALYAAIFLVGFCPNGVLTLTLAIPAGFKDRTLTASAVGLMSSIGNVGSIVMPVVIGYIKDVTGSFMLGLALLALMAEGMLVLGLLNKNL